MAAAAKSQFRTEATACLLGNPCCWAAATVAAGLVALAVIQPSACSSVAACAAKHDAIPSRYNAYAAYGLGMVLVGETANLISTFKGAREAMSMIPDLRSRCLPSLLLVLSFLVLIGESSVFAASSHPWFASSRPDLDGPVFTVTFLEWLIIVPMLLVMAGHCALGRPLREMGRPIIVTNVYIIFAWMALLTTSAMMRWSLIAATFTMYAWASLDMIIWVADYLRAAPADLSSRSLRPVLSLGLIALFAVYAVIYMSVLFGAMGPRTERTVFLMLNVGSKLCFSIAFVVIRGNEYHSTLTGVLKKLSTSNVAIVSILRGSFDILLPCVGDADGHCQLARPGAGDMQELEHALQRKVAGGAFGDLLADDAERSRFAAYVRNAQRQSEEPKALATDSNQPDWAFNVSGSLPPVAQVLNCRLSLGGAAGQKQGSVGCAVHLSVVPGAMHFGPGYQMIAAVRFMEESSANRPEAATPAPEFQAYEPRSGSPEHFQIHDSLETDDLAAATDIADAYERAFMHPLATPPRDNSKSEDRMIASLMDVAKLGMSSILRSVRSASIDGEAEEASGDGASGRNEEGSFLQPATKPSKGTKSVTIVNDVAAARSMTSEEESEDSASVFHVKTYQPGKVELAEKAPTPRTPSLTGSSVSQSGKFKALASFLEPEEEMLPRRKAASPNDKRKAAVAPDVVLPFVDEEEKLASPAAKKNGARALCGSVAEPVVAVQEELLSSDCVTVDVRAKAKCTDVTVTMQVAPVQFGLAVGTVALAAAVSLLTSRPR